MRRRAERGEAIPTFEWLVAIDTDECVIWPFNLSKGGYGQLYVQGIKRYTHRRALETRVGPPPADGMLAIHGPCHNRACMNYRHLRWGTPTENVNERLRDGTDNRGTKCAWAKLTAQDVIEIRSSDKNTVELGRRYGVSSGVISRVKRRLSYLDVEEAA